MKYTAQQLIVIILVSAIAIGFIIISIGEILPDKQHIQPPFTVEDYCRLEEYKPMECH